MKEKIEPPAHDQFITNRELRIKVVVVLVRVVLGDEQRRGGIVDETIPIVDNEVKLVDFEHSLGQYKDEESAGEEHEQSELDVAIAFVELVAFAFGRCRRRRGHCGGDRGRMVDASVRVVHRTSRLVECRRVRADLVVDCH